MDYIMLWVDDVFLFDVGMMVMECFLNLVGMKGCGEVGVIGVMFVVINVIINVLGVDLIDMFVILECIWCVVNGFQFEEIFGMYEFNYKKVGFLEEVKVMFVGVDDVKFLLGGQIFLLMMK